MSTSPVERDPGAGGPVERYMHQLSDARGGRRLPNELLLVGAFALLVLLFSVWSPVFLTPENWTNILRQTTFVSILAVGMTMVIIAGEFDLSAGSTVALCGVVAGLAMQQVADSWLIGAFFGVLTGTVVGLFNGLLTTRAGIPSFLATLGMLGVARGAAMFITNTRPVIISEQDYWNIFGEGMFLGVPAPILWTVIVAIIGTYVLQFSTFGRKIYSTGGNAKAARYSGIDTKRVKLTVLAISGSLAGLVGLILSGQSHAARPDVGSGMELDAITAAVLGGAALTGGRGTIWGAIIGSLMIGVLNNGLVLVGVDASLQLGIKGAIIWAAVVISRGRARDA